MPYLLICGLEYNVNEIAKHVAWKGQRMIITSVVQVDKVRAKKSCVLF